MYELYKKEEYVFANVPVKVFFHTLSGENIYTYLQDIRLMHCIDTIKRDVSVNLSAAALDSRFPNVKSFIETFKRYMGCTPSEWLRHLSDSGEK